MGCALNRETLTGSGGVKNDVTIAQRWRGAKLSRA
jgi:hypothetical protein